jgi:class 3 adenylate cyclase/tetratricopeptide (TPR) repeat protein
MECPRCQFVNPEDFQFCGKCGHSFGESSEIERTVAEAEGERKHVTVLFSDLSGYTAMCERLDPEEVKEIMSRIFGDIAQVVSKYEGFVEKFVGDAVMALFGVPKAHEDDPVRAIRAAGEINDLVVALSPQLEEKIGKPLSMHSGINTGLVVTGEVDLEKGTHGVAGDTINLAARLCSLANPGEIVVGLDTCRQAEGHFTFAALDPTEVKGKAEPVQAYRVESLREEPRKIHRLQGLRADLIGRDLQMAVLVEAVEKLRRGEGSVIAISGDAGSGKSRLIEELKAALDFDEIQWREGHAYSYTQNMPYYPLIKLLTHAFQIDESDRSEAIRTKVETSVAHLLGAGNKFTPYIGSLFALTYPEIGGGSPEYWKNKLWESIQAILSALVDRGATIVCFEDLNWADTSSIELFKHLLKSTPPKALFICTYRSHFTFFDRDLIDNLKDHYWEIYLKDLATNEAQEMLESLLGTQSTPTELYEVVRQKAEGNPFYIEELVNSLIESEILTRDNSNWNLTRKITEADIPTTIQGVLTARVDRLEKHFKRILQEASVIGRAFLYKILERITDIDSDVDQYLAGLEGLDLIRTQSMEPELEYIFKHALTQEVVYSGLLKKERQAIHERIGLAIEQLFSDRLSEFYETLSYHFAQGKSVRKAVNYLTLSGEKSEKRNSVQEAHQYYKEAYDLLANQPGRTKEEDELLIDLILKWAFVFSYRGDLNGLDDLLTANVDLAKSLGDKARLGVFYGFMGTVPWFQENFRKAYKYLSNALKLGEEVDNQQVIGTACTWLSYVSAQLGLSDEAIRHGERARAISESLDDHWLYIKSLDGLALAHYVRADKQDVQEAGMALLDYSNRHSYIRGIVLGHINIGRSQLIDGDIPSAVKSFERAAQISADPLYTELSKFHLGQSYLLIGQLDKAQDVFQETVDFCQKVGAKNYITPIQGMLGVILIAKGEMFRGLKMIEGAVASFMENERRYTRASFENILGKVYAQIMERAGPIRLSYVVKNIFFLLRNVPLAFKKAQTHFNKAIEVAKEIGAKEIQAQANLHLGLLFKEKGRKTEARECIIKAVRLFEQCGAKVYLKQAKEALASLD